MENINKIQIVPDEVYEVGADKVNVIPEWSVKDDSTLYEKVRKLAHSTFDLSKFTVVGSPSITDDGIASGLSGIALTLNYDRLNLYNAETWEAEFGVYINDNSGSIYTSQCGINFTNTQFPLAGGIYLSGDSKIRFFRNDVWSIESPVFNIGDFIKAKLKYDNATGTYSMYISTNGGTYTFINSYTPTDEDKRLSMGTSGNIQLMSNNTGGYPALSTGNFDLKQFSITVDGVPVFSGNKTGIDTIKPDDYTVVGTPTINADGVIISADGSNYIQKSISFSGNTLTYEGQFYLEPDNTLSANTNRAIFNIGKFGMGIRYQQSNEKYMFAFGEETNWSNNNSSNQSNIYFTEKGLYKYKISINLSTGVITLTYTKPDGTVIAPFTVTYMNNAGVATSVSTATVVQICKGADYSFVKDIDLNTIKFYVDGNLVYQPCLKIPYTEAELNQKVVDVKYRDRVKDLFEQVGYNGYHTIDEDNKNFTLPTHKFTDIIDHKEDADGTVAEQRVDMTVMAYGVAENGTDVNLPIEFADEDYLVGGVTVSAKDTDSFTPSSSGTWFARGKGKI